MAILKINKKTFEREIGKVDEKMQEKIALFGTPVESVSGGDIELEIFPDRPDMLSYQGFKRAFLSFLGKQTGLKEYKIKKPAKDYKVVIEKSVEAVRPFTACAIIKNIKFDDEKIKEIIDIQEKLHFTVGRKRKKLAIGVYPLEKIKLPITYKALEPDKIKFQPLESEREMDGLQILQRHPAGRDYAHLLAGKQKFPIFVDADGNILSMPPIINSHLTGKITEKTKDVFIECSGFDFEILKKALNMIVTTLADQSSNVEVYQMELHYGNKKELTPELKPEKMKINLDNVNKLLGLELNEKQIRTFLERMGYNYKNKFVEVPGWRTDVLHEVDLVEDVAIAFGYENFAPEIPPVSTIGSEDKKETVKRRISDILVGLRFLEVSNFHLTKKDDQFMKMGLNAKSSNEKFVEVEDSKTDFTILRKDLSHYILKILSENVDAEYPQAIFEIGTVFEGVEEKINLAIAITAGNFTELKQVLEYLGRMLDVKIQLKEPSDSNSLPKHFIEGRAAEVFIDGKDAGFIGEIHPKILRLWKLKMPVVLLEMELGEVTR